MKRKIAKLFTESKALITHFGMVNLLLIPLFLLFNLGYFHVISQEKISIDSQQISIASERINMISFVIETTISSIHSDLHVIRDADETQKYFDNPNQANYEEFQNMIFRIAKNKPEFLSVEIVGLDGQELVKVNRVDAELVISDEDELTSQINNPNFIVGSSIDNYHLFISEISIWPEESMLIPSITFVLGIYDDLDEKKAILMLDYNANALLQIFSHVDNTKLSYIQLGLINNNTIWLTRTNNDSNFYLSDYSQSLAFLLDDDLEQDSLIISDLDFSEKIDHHILNTTGFIKIFSIIDFNEAYDDQGSFLLRQPISIFLLNISLLLGVTFILVILKSKNDDKILLNANMYLSDKNNDGVLITNNKEEITYVNEAFESGFGFKAKEVIGNKPSDVLGRLNFNIEERLKLNEYVFSDHIWNRTKSGIYLLKYLRIRPEIALNNKLKHFIAIYSRPQFSLETLSLSSLSNIKTTLKVLISGFDDLIFIENSSCFIVIKTSNELENFGWKGNLFDASEKLKLPIFLAENLNDIYRIAVPENGYIILFTNLIENDKNLETQINVITDLIDKYKHLSASRINLKYDIGVAVTTDDVNNKEDLLYNSLIALEKTKNLRNVKHTIYDLNIKKRMDRDKDIFEQLENAFAKDEFYLKYQPQFDLTTHDLIGVEALLRWKNEKLGEIMPNDFIPIIENSYFVNQLTKTVLSKVINDFSSIFSKMSKEFRVSINLTFFDFSEEYLLINLVKVIKDSTMKTENFCFEITESGYLENVEKTNHIIDFLHKNGVIVALDDFGTGYSSLSFLRNLKVDQVKIDRSFIKDYPSEDKGMMFKALATLLNNMGFSIVVEGVETYDHLILAQQSKCNKVQGYYFSKPIVISEFIKNYIKK